VHLFAPMGKTPSIHNFFGMNGGDDETRTRDLCRDRIGWQTPMATKDCIGPGSVCRVCSRKTKSAKHPEECVMEPCASAVAKCIPTRT
jgi:hypothetical protein